MGRRRKEFSRSSFFKADRQRIWDAAYAAAFVTRFEQAATRVGFDTAVEHDHAEEAEHVANLAVEQLDTWFREGRGE